MADTVVAQQNTPEKKSSKKDFIFAVGRRKEAVARIRLYPKATDTIKSGEILVNGNPIDVYFSGDISKAIYNEPFRITNVLGKVAATIKVMGGGKNSQLDAVIQGLARALDTMDHEKFRPILKKRGFLSVDARVRQRRKVGMGGKSRRKKQSPKR